LHEQKVTFLLVGGIIIVFAGILSYLLARRLVRPLEDLAEGTRRLASGDYERRVEVKGGDEIGNLSKDFNLLALTLEKNEEARRQWIADISHELRTPLGILRGETEALLDGVRQPDHAALQSLNTETLRLGRLVDDLYQLSMSDLGALSYRKKILNLAGLIEELAESYRNEFDQHGLSLTLTYEGSQGIQAFGDQERLHQLFTNLFENSLKYTDSGGGLEITLAIEGRNLSINFQDTAPTVPVAELEKLFDRLYRFESSRNRQTGGAGLGLSICKNIIEAHEGSISAAVSPLGGLWIKVSLPLTGNA